MIKYLALFSIISTTIMSSIIPVIKDEDVMNKGNALRVFYETEACPSEGNKFDSFWSSKNESYLSEAEKEQVNKFKEKVSKGEVLTISETNILKKLKSQVIKKKLGDEKFKELEKLLEKREDSVELTLPERQRLYELNKEARE